MVMIPNILMHGVIDFVGYSDAAEDEVPLPQFNSCKNPECSRTVEDEFNMCNHCCHMFKHFLMFSLVVPTKQRDNMERVGAPTLVYLVYS